MSLWPKWRNRFFGWDSGRSQGQAQETAAAPTPRHRPKKPRPHRDKSPFERGAELKAKRGGGDQAAVWQVIEALAVRYKTTPMAIAQRPYVEFLFDLACATRGWQQEEAQRAEWERKHGK